MIGVSQVTLTFKEHSNRGLSDGQVRGRDYHGVWRTLIRTSDAIEPLADANRIMDLPLPPKSGGGIDYH